MTATLAEATALFDVSVWPRYSALYEINTWFGFRNWAGNTERKLICLLYLPPNGTLLLRMASTRFGSWEFGNEVPRAPRLPIAMRVCSATFGELFQTSARVTM